ncbi:serine carboxypeptidase-like 12 [Ricinus communis]|uniref:serine carboxypeptidase-like 12 n=1 Tax=Ricinus communis TaxID=3988 RepID=UPI00201B001C|nr:serine carboxypeptidase-like 12 [Ricinus communis]
MASTSARNSVLNCACFHLLLLLFFAENTESGRIVKTLPGYSGDLPFQLETGYITVNESELFYLFVESQGKPQQDPLLVYLIGGPGCSALNGFFFQTGPLVLNTANYSGGLPQLLNNPYSWTKSSSIIFVDAPVGTGYSYATIPEGYYTSDTESTAQIYMFLRKWLFDHQEYIENRFFIATDSYSGVIAPILAQEILEGNKAGLQPAINLEGILSGSPHINATLESNCVIPLAYHLALVSQSLYESAKNSCNGNYVDVDSSNAACLEDLEEIDACIDPINDENILDPVCAKLSPKSDGEQFRRSLRENSRNSRTRFRKFHNYWCRNFEYKLLDIWANDKSVQDALYVRRGTIEEWYRCNISLQENAYTYNIQSAVDYYRNLSANYGTQVLLYSGDHDLVVPYISTLDWMETLNLTVDYAWRPWFVEGQVAGYTLRYENYGFRMTFATLKGSGHSPTQYKPLQCYNMFERWIHYYPL